MTSALSCENVLVLCFVKHIFHLVFEVFVVCCRYRFLMSGVHFEISELENYRHENRFV